MPLSLLRSMPLHRPYVLPGPSSHRNKPTDSSDMKSLNNVSMTQTHDTSLKDATDNSSSAFSILSERAFTCRITGKLHRVLSVSIIKLHASERHARHCCFVRPCETIQGMHNTSSSVFNVAVQCRPSSYRLA